MSLKAWKETYYPVPADAAVSTDLAAAEHALRKWEGLRPEVLKRYAVQRDPSGGSGLVNISTLDDTEDRFHINGGSCSLCRKYDRPSFIPDCNKCPLTHARDGHSCTRSRPGETYSPYGFWIHDSNPEPMIRDLEKTVRMLKEAESKPETEPDSQS